ncbi:MAG: transketolase C-terminal domain-containing protein [Alphaproteobacteria bacterium]
MSEAINRVIAGALEGPEPVMVLGQDVGPHGGVFGVTRGLWEKYGDDVIRDGPLCESSTVGFGIGLAISGVRAIVELEIFDFVGVAMDQVFNQAAKLHYFTGGKLSVPLVIRAPIGARIGMGPQHSQSLEAWFMHIPGLKVAMPSNAADAYGLLRTALADSNPVLFLECARAYGRRAEVDLDAPPIPFGRARIACEGRDVTIVAFSGMVDEALAAAGRLKEEGVAAEVIDPRTIAPLDREAILDSVRKTGRLVITHDAHKTAGIGAEIATLVVEGAFDALKAPPERVAALDVPIPSGPLLVEVYPNADGIIAAVRRTLGKGRA